METIEANYIYRTEQFTFSGSILQNDTRNLGRFFQTFEPPEKLITTFDNSGELKSKGIELISSCQQNDQFLFEFSSTYVDIDDVKNNVEVGNSPELLWKAMASYEFNTLVFHS